LNISAGDKFAVISDGENILLLPVENKIKQNMSFARVKILESFSAGERLYAELFA